MLKGMKYDIYNPMFRVVCHRFLRESGSCDEAGRLSVMSATPCKQTEMLRWCSKLSRLIWVWASVLGKHTLGVSQCQGYFLGRTGPSKSFPSEARRGSSLAFGEHVNGTG